MPQCKVCAAPYKEFVENLLRTPGRSERSICEVVNQRYKPDPPLYAHSLKSHKAHFEMDPEGTSAIRQTIEALREEARAAPPTVQAAYHILVQQLSGLEATKPDAATALKAVQAITQITGMKTQQALFAAFLERMFTAERPAEVGGPLRAELERS